MTLYHGSLVEFDAFSKSVSPRFSTDQYLLGHFFADNPRHAVRYAMLSDEEIEDLLGLPIDEIDEDDDELRELTTSIPGFLYVVEARYSSMKVVPASASGTSEIVRMQNDFGPGDFARYLAGVMAEGHDCIHFDSGDGDGEYVFLDATDLRIIDRVPGIALQDATSNKTPAFAPRF